MNSPTFRVAPGSGTLSSAVAIAPSGSTLLLQPGTYSENSTISLSGMSLSILGDGAQSTIISFAGSDGFKFTVTGSNDRINIGGFTLLTNGAGTKNGIIIIGPPATNTGCNIHDIEFGTNGGTYWSECIRMEEAWYTTIVNCMFLGDTSTNPNGTLIHLLSCNHINISGCTGIGANIGISMEKKSSASHPCQEIRIINSAILVVNYGIYINEGSLLQVTNTNFDFIHSYGIYAANGISLRVDNSFINLDKSNAYGIYLSTGSVTSSVANTKISANNGLSNINGIALQSDGATISGNHISGSSMSTGIWVINGTRTSIVGNLVENMSANGIVLASTALRAVISANICTNTRTGIYVAGQVASIVGNEIENMSANGIYLDTSSQRTLVANNICMSTTSGISNGGTNNVLGTNIVF